MVLPHNCPECLSGERSRGLCVSSASEPCLYISDKGVVFIEPIDKYKCKTCNYIYGDHKLYLIDNAYYIKNGPEYVKMHHAEITIPGSIEFVVCIYIHISAIGNAILTKDDGAFRLIYFENTCVPVCDNMVKLSTGQKIGIISISDKITAIDEMGQAVHYNFIEGLKIGDLIEFENKHMKITIDENYNATYECLGGKNTKPAINVRSDEYEQ